MRYRVEVAPAAGGDLKRLPRSVHEALQDAITALGDDPWPPGSRKVIGRERSHRIRVGAFRVIYDVFDDERLVVVARVARRTETTYRRLR